MKKYVFLLALLSVLAGVTLYSLYNIDNTKRSTTAGNNFYKVFFSKEDNTLLEEIGSNWKYLANFKSAFNHVSNLTPIEAASIYSNMANNEAVPNVLRELAQYLEVMNSFYRDEKINEDKINNLESITVYPYSSQEAIAIIKIHNNDIKGAIEILHSLLNDRKCPALIKANAQGLLRIYRT